VLKRVVLVAVIAAFGVGGIATPAFANTEVWVDVCDSALPNNCDTFIAWSPLVTGGEYVAVYTGDCAGPGQNIPTLHINCIYAEVDLPASPPS